MTANRLGLWPLRLLWLGSAFAIAPAVGDALEGASAGMRWLSAIGLYAAWAVCLLVTLVPRTAGLTVLRIGGPAALAVAAWAAVAGGPPALSDAGALAWAAAVAAVSLTATTADAMVDGSSYGAERRFALRTPAALLVGPVELVWVAVISGMVVGPALLASQRWLAGAILLPVGVVLAGAGARSLHQLARRWLVFVPAGVVLHDPLLTADPALFPHRIVAGLGPAPAEDDGAALDLTGGAIGLVLELELRQQVTVGVRRRRRQPVDETADRVRFTPGRPGAVLAEADRRRLARVSL